MTNFRSKAREIKAAGEAERGNFEPQGVPKRMYEYWLHNTRSSKGGKIRRGERRENFCHFWRVVAIWAPLMWIVDFIDKAAPFIFGIIALAGVIALIYVFATEAEAWVILGQGLLLLLGLTSAALGIFGGLSLAHGEEGQSKYDLPPFKWGLAMSIIGLPTAIVTYILAKVCILYNKHLSQHTAKIALGILATLGVAFLVILFVVEGLVALLTVLGLVVLGMGAAFILMALGSRLADHLAGKRKLEEEARRKALEDYILKNGRMPQKATRKPSKIDKFFRGVGDFIILIAQVVRVSKWKICPMVDIKR